MKNLMQLLVYASDKNLVTASKRIDGFGLGIKHQSFLLMLASKDTNIYMSICYIIPRQGYLFPSDLP